MTQRPLTLVCPLPFLGCLCKLDDDSLHLLLQRFAPPSGLSISGFTDVLQRDTAFTHKPAFVGVHSA